MQPNQQFGRYEVKALLGEGGMGWVYHAYDTTLRRDVALKIPRFGRNTDGALIERFLHESRAAAQIEHPNVCAVYDAGAIDGVYYITMRRVRGQTLARRLMQGSYSPLEAARLVHKLTMALSAIHRRGMLHRDIKTSNILLDDDGEPLLTDFGLAQFVTPVMPIETPIQRDESRPLEVATDTVTETDSSTGEVVSPVASNTRTFPLIGSIHYLAPELFSSHDPDVRSDVYGLGVVLYRMLSGCLPFPGPLPEVYASLVRGIVTPPSRHEPGVPRDLEAICLKAMALEPAVRYQSADELGGALHAWLTHRMRIPARMRLNPRTGFALAGCVAAIFLGIVIYLKTGNGTLVLDVHDADATLVVDGTPTMITLDESSISLSVGSHNIEIVRKDKTAETRPVIIRWRGDSVLLTVSAPTTSAISPTVPPRVAIGWGQPRCDLEGTRFYPVASRVHLPNLALSPLWSTRGNQALTGDIDGDGQLELIIGDQATLNAYDLVGVPATKEIPQCLWQQPDIGQLNVVANITGSSAAEIIVSGAEGDELVLSILDAGKGELLKKLRTHGEFAQDNSHFDHKAKIIAVAVADLQQDGDKEIIAVKCMEGKTARSRGVVTFDFRTGNELYYHFIGPMVGDLSIGKLNGVNIAHGTFGPANGVIGADGTRDDSCYVFYRIGATGNSPWFGPRLFDGKGFVRSSVGLSDFDNDKRLDIVATSYRFQGTDWGPEMLPRHEDLGRVYLLDPLNGSTRPGYERDFDIGVELAGIADFDGRGAPEILVRSRDCEIREESLLVLRPEKELPSLYTHAWHDASVQVCAINDINGDQRPEIIATVCVRVDGKLTSTLFVLASDLTDLCQWQADGILSSAIVSDVNDDGVNEIIAIDNEKVTVLAPILPSR